MSLSFDIAILPDRTTQTDAENTNEAQAKFTIVAVSIAPPISTCLNGLALANGTGADLRLSSLTPVCLQSILGADCILFRRVIPLEPVTY